MAVAVNETLLPASVGLDNAPPSEGPAVIDGAVLNIQLRLLPESVELVWETAVPAEASESFTFTYDTAAVPLRVNPHLVGVELERKERSWPEAPANVSVPPEAMVWVAEAGKVRVSALVTDFVKL